MTSLRGFTRTEFPKRVKTEAFKRCCRDGRPYCETCGIELRGGNIIYEHDQADGLGGEPTLENCKVHCKSCAQKKTTEHDNPIMAKADAQLKKNYGISKGRSKFACSRDSAFKKKIGTGEVVRR